MVVGIRWSACCGRVSANSCGSLQDSSVARHRLFNSTELPSLPSVLMTPRAAAEKASRGQVLEARFGREPLKLPEGLKSTQRQCASAVKPLRVLDSFGKVRSFPLNLPSALSTAHGVLFHRDLGPLEETLDVSLFSDAAGSPSWRRRRNL
eukprot:SRR837773.25003.p2 GENE.SRR837773.25003~~SRR837773.25003.p2  ORF type:complete len:176 (-),score=17.16 SRR837773.25003:40-489(-)